MLGLWHRTYLTNKKCWTRSIQRCYLQPERPPSCPFEKYQGNPACPGLPQVTTQWMQWCARLQLKPKLYGKIWGGNEIFFKTFYQGMYTKFCSSLWPISFLSWKFRKNRNLYVQWEMGWITKNPHDGVHHAKVSKAQRARGRDISQGCELMSPQPICRDLISKFYRKWI